MKQGAEGEVDDEGWQQLERAADSALTATTNLRLARSYLRGARLRGASVT